MLILTRKIGETVVIPKLNITITVADIRKDVVRLGVTAPPEIEVHRSEVWERIQAERTQE